MDACTHMCVHVCVKGTQGMCECEKAKRATGLSTNTVLTEMPQVWSDLTDTGQDPVRRQGSQERPGPPSLRLSAAWGRPVTGWLGASWKAQLQINGPGSLSPLGTGVLWLSSPDSEAGSRRL